jgi:HEPN domain-containing protein/predicted nucleotidyltransferase
MKTDLNHLPERKREQVTAIAAVVQANAPVDMVILFGSYARGDWVEDLGTGYFSDFDLMAIVESEALADDLSLWSKITAQIRPYGGHIPVTLLVHDIRQFNHEVRVGQYFYADVVNEGVVLYDSGRFKLARPKALTPAERLALAQHNFEYWYQSANEFWRGAGYYMARGLGAHAAFLLHQATERYFHAVLLVYTGYKPKSHDIQALAEQTAPMHPVLAGALPRTEPEDKHLFDLLKRGYIDARYSKSYRVTPSELAGMRDRVLDVAERVRKACGDKLIRLSPDGAIGELPAAPTASESIELPNLPDLADPKAVETWRDAIVQMSQERSEQRFREGEQLGEERGRREGEKQGRQEGLREGEQLGRQQERARAILDVLQRRGIALTDTQAERIAACRDEVTLARWWERAWSVESVDEL